MEAYTAQLKRRKPMFHNVNEDWLSWKGVTKWKAVNKQVDLATKKKGLIDEHPKCPRVERTKEFRRTVNTKMTENILGKVREVAHGAYTTLMDNHRVPKKLAAKKICSREQSLPQFPILNEGSTPENLCLHERFASRKGDS